jgi:predicted HAD superfamily phosphohydrolase YqeG
LFGEHLDPIFTPPWNRCTEITGQVLREHGIAMLSRNLTAGLLNIHQLAECLIHIDWLAKAKGRRIPCSDVSSVIARRVADASTPIGIMFTTPRWRRRLRGLRGARRTVTSHPKARVTDEKCGDGVMTDRMSDGRISLLAAMPLSEEIRERVVIE